MTRLVTYENRRSGPPGYTNLRVANEWSDDGGAEQLPDAVGDRRRGNHDRELPGGAGTDRTSTGPAHDPAHEQAGGRGQEDRQAGCRTAAREGPRDQGNERARGEE